MWFDNGVEYPECDFHDIQLIAVDSAKSGDIFIEVGTFLGEGLHCLMNKIAKRQQQDPAFVAKVFCADNFDLHFMNRENTDHFDMNIEPVLVLDREKRLLSFGYKGMAVEFFNKLREAKKEKFLTGCLIGKSWDIASSFADKSIHFCFIDAGHSYDAVKLDLQAWYPKMKENGVFSGHDWYSGPGVRRAVIEFAKEKQLSIQTFQSGWRLVPQA